MLYFAILLSFFVRVCCSQKLTYFSAPGHWDVAKGHECDHFLCTPSKRTWFPHYPSKYYNNITACDELIKRGVHKVEFYGDSFMRQIYAAMLITLNGDYKYGSIANPKKDATCDYQRQFWEKRCNTQQLNHYGYVCGNKIHLDPILHHTPDLRSCQNRNGTVFLWSIGNYKLFGNGRYAKNNGVNNATMYQKLFEVSNVCPQMRVSKGDFTGSLSGRCSGWWISTHYRVLSPFRELDESPEDIRRYNEDQRMYFQNTENCGNMNYVDVWNMTASLTQTYYEDAKKMTYDNVHWGYEVNMMKAQIILNAMLSSTSTF